MADHNGEKKDFSEEVGNCEKRKIKARFQKHEGMWYAVSLFGIVGWSVAVPALLGVAVGLWLDSITGGKVSWTITFLLIGVCIGCITAWIWIKRESRNE